MYVNRFRNEIILFALLLCSYAFAAPSSNPANWPSLPTLHFQGKPLNLQQSRTVQLRHRKQCYHKGWVCQQACQKRYPQHQLPILYHGCVNSCRVRYVNCLHND